jgi:enoyl-CoA hydratase
MIRVRPTMILARLVTAERFGTTMWAWQRQSGKRSAMDSVFHMHHLAHAHMQLTTGSIVGGMGAKDIAGSGRKKD